MCSRETTSNCESSEDVLADDEEDFLVVEGLCRDPRYAPLCSFYSLFETLLSHKNVTKNFIRKKLLAFLDYLTTYRAWSAPLGFADTLATYRNSTIEDLNDDIVFYNTNAMAMFAYVFNMRIELYSIGRSEVMACQYFGVKRKPVKRVFMADNCYFLLKKCLPKTNTFSTKICSEMEYLNQRSCGQAYISGIKQPPKAYVKYGGWNPVEYSGTKKLSLATRDEKAELSRRVDAKWNIGEKSWNATEGKNVRFEHSKASEKINNIEDTICKDAPDHIVESVVKMIDTNRLADVWNSEQTNINDTEEQQCPRIGTTKKDLQAGITHVAVPGRLKFYSELKEYGFIVMDDGQEVFIHKADLLVQNIDTKSLAYHRRFYEIFVRFDIEEYQGKTQRHRKAINMVILHMQPCVN